MADVLSDRYQNLLTGSYDCVDRVVLNGYFVRGITGVGSAYGGDDCTDRTTIWTMRT